MLIVAGDGDPSEPVCEAVRRLPDSRLERGHEPASALPRRPPPSQRGALPDRDPHALAPADPRLRPDAVRRGLVGKTVIRCLKRFVAREIYHALIEDHQPVRPAPRLPTWAFLASSGSAFGLATMAGSDRVRWPCRTGTLTDPERAYAASAVTVRRRTPVSEPQRYFPRSTTGARDEPQASRCRSRAGPSSAAGGLDDGRAPLLRVRTSRSSGQCYLAGRIRPARIWHKLLKPAKRRVTEADRRSEEAEAP